MPQPCAADEWDASIEKVGSAVQRASTVALSLLLSGLGGTPIILSTENAVIRDRATGVEIARGETGDNNVWMLDQLRRDLKAMTTTRFLAKWRNGDDWVKALRNL